MILKSYIPHYSPDIDLICDIGNGMLRKIEGEMHRKMFVETLMLCMVGELKRIADREKGRDDESQVSGEPIQGDS